MTIMQHPTAARQQPTATQHPLVAAILETARCYDGDLTAEQANTIALGLVGERFIGDFTYIVGLYNEAEGVGIGAHSGDVPEDFARRLRADAEQYAVWLASNVLAGAR